MEIVVDQQAQLEVYRDLAVSKLATLSKQKQNLIQNSKFISLFFL